MIISIDTESDIKLICSSALVVEFLFGSMMHFLILYCDNVFEADHTKNIIGDKC